MPRPDPPYSKPGIVADGINDARRTTRRDGLNQQHMLQRSTPGTDPYSRPLSKFGGIRLHNGRNLCVPWKRHAVDQTIRRGERFCYQRERDERQQRQGLVTPGTARLALLTAPPRVLRRYAARGIDRFMPRAELCRASFSDGTHIASSAVTRSA